MTSELIMNISENFTIEEMEHSDIAKSKGIINQITAFSQRDALFSLVRNVLQPLRNLYGKPMNVNSGYRSLELNKEVGGVATSQHCKGEAADIATGSAAESYRLAKLAKENNIPFDQMILYPTFVHFSHKLNDKQRGNILYNSSYKGKKL